MQLNKEVLTTRSQFPPDLKVGPLNVYPEKAVQFGEGNFMRAFVDWMINELNLQGLFQGRIVLVQPIEEGLCEEINKQDGLYTLYLRGLEQGVVREETSIVTAVSRCIDPYRNWDALLKCAENPELSFMFSNTTEAGIAFVDEPFSGRVQQSFPAKVTAFLYHRFKTLGNSPDRGLIIIPCELIDRNGDELKRIVLKYCRAWNLPDQFINWITNANHFINSLVDRIVTGFPRGNSDSWFTELGYEDRLLDTAEIYHLWVIESRPELLDGLPLRQAGLNVLTVPDIKPYRTRKVRILNGAHTLMVPPAYLCGLETVKETMDDRLFNTFLKLSLEKEVIPTLDLPRQELFDFATEVLERFQNPFIRHHLIDIALNSISKFKVRVLPSLQKYVDLYGELPVLTCFSMAALCVFYRINALSESGAVAHRDSDKYLVRDDPGLLTFFHEAWKHCDGSFSGCLQLADEVLGNLDLWDRDLSKIEGLTQLLGTNIYNILERGVRESLEALLEDWSTLR